MLEKQERFLGRKGWALWQLHKRIVSDVRQVCRQTVNDKAAMVSGPETAYFPGKAVYPREHGSRPVST